MKIQTLLLCLLSISGALTQSCTTKTSSVSLVMATEEQQWWGLQDVFFTGENLSYGISDTSYFDVIPPVKTADVEHAYAKPAQIVKAVPFLQSINGAWLNSFALLDHTNGYNVFWAFGTAIQGTKTPKFDIVTPVLPQTTTQSCFGLDLIGTLTPRAVVDCFDATTNKNYFQVVYADKSVQVEATTDYVQTGVTGRQVEVKRAASLLEEVVYIYRGTPVQSAPSTVDNSVIEVFILDSENNLQVAGVLDKATLAALTGDRSGTFKFNLVEFELDNGFVYVLDQGGKIYRLKFQANGMWVLDSTLDLKSNRPFAMDVNNKLNSIGGYTTNVVVLHWDTFVLYEWNTDSQEYTQLRIYETEFFLDPTNVPNFQISQDFILLQNNQLDIGSDLITIYETTTNKILTRTQVPSNLHWLINPYEKRFVSLGQTKAQAWAFSEGQLVLKSIKTPTAKTLTVTLTATSTIDGKNVQCTSTINADVYDRANAQIIQVGDQTNPLPLPEFISQNTQFPLRQLVSGPNINFEQYIPTQESQKFLGEQAQTQQEVNLTQVAVQKLKLRSTSTLYPKAENVIFVDTLGFDNPEFYYEVFQTNDFRISVFHCEVSDLYSTTTVCSLAGTFNSTVALTKQGFQTWLNAEQVTVGAITSPTQISLYVCGGSSCKTVYNITYDTDVTITSFQFLNRHLWITRADQIIDVYNSFFPFDQQSTVDVNVAKENGYTGEWNPVKVFGNKYLNPNLIFIDNKINLLVADFHSQVTFITAIDYVLTNPQVEVAVGLKTFFIAEANGQDSKLREFNYEDLADIKLQKDVYLYWYSFQTPLQADFSVMNGYFYIRALCIKCDLTFVLVFKPNTSQRDCLFRAINTGEKVLDGKNLLFSPSGDQYMFLYVNTGKLQNSYSILNQYTVQVGPGVTTQMVTKNVKFTMRAVNFNWENSQDYQLSVTVFNTRSSVEFNQTAFAGATQGKFKAPHGSLTTIPFGSNWFNGNVLKYIIECKDCGTAIKLENYVDPAPLPFPLDEVTDFDSFGDRGFLAQSAKNLWFLKDGKQVAPFLDLDLPEGMECKLVNSVPSGIYILSVCQTSTRKYVHITSCVAQNECFSAGYLPLTGAKEIQKFATVETLWGVSLVVLSVNSLSLNSYSEGSIITYTLVSQGDIWAIQKTNEVTLTPPTNPTGKFYPADMTFLEYSSGFYKFFITDAEAGLWTVNGKVVNGFLSVDNTGTLINLSETINGYGGFISTTTRYQGVALYKSEITDPKNIDAHIILTTNNVAHFAIGLTFDNSDPVNNPALFTQAHVDYEFNRYGGAPALNKVKVSGNYLFIVYGSTKSSFVNTLLRYEIPATEPAQLGVQLTPAEIQYVGGEEISSSTFANYLPLYFENVTNTPTLYSNQYSNYKLNQQQNYPRLVINSTSGLQSQDFTLIAYNEQVGSSAQVTSTLEAFDIPATKSSWKWWYTLLIVLGGLVLIIASFFIYKKFIGGSKVKESLLGQTTSENMA